MINPGDSPSRLGFPLTEEQQLVSKTARDFGRTRLAPGARARDESCAFPLEFIPELAELGLLAMKVPIEEGGAGVDNVSYFLAMEGIAESCASTAVILASSNLATYILAEHANAAQKERWLRPYAEGKLGPASFCLTEPHAGSDAAAVKTIARLEGDEYVLDGAKMWITSGAHAGIFIVFARTTEAGGHKGMGCFVVERGTPGLEIGKDEEKMGQRASGTVALFFDNCRIPKANLIGEPGYGYSIALSALGGGRVGIAGLSLGLAEAAIKEGVAYASEREAFGTRIIDFQNSQFALATCRTELDAAWLMTLRAATLLDNHGRAPMETSMAKLYASEVAHRVVDQMLQLHGGYGYSKEYAIERIYRDVRVTRIYEGANEIQKVVIAKEMLR